MTTQADTIVVVDPKIEQNAQRILVARAVGKRAILPVLAAAVAALTTISIIKKFS